MHAIFGSVSPCMHFHHEIGLFCGKFWSISACYKHTHTQYDCELTVLSFWWNIHSASDKFHSINLWSVLIILHRLFVHFIALRSSRVCVFIWVCAKNIFTSQTDAEILQSQLIMDMWLAYSVLKSLPLSSCRFFSLYLSFYLILTVARSLHKYDHLLTNWERQERAWNSGILRQRWCYVCRYKGIVNETNKSSW